jgi:hypothetical protein
MLLKNVLLERLVLPHNHFTDAVASSFAQARH